MEQFGDCYRFVFSPLLSDPMKINWLNLLICLIGIISNIILFTLLFGPLHPLSAMIVGIVWGLFFPGIDND
jgi:hypothetical protein